MGERCIRCGKGVHTTFDVPDPKTGLCAYCSKADEEAASAGREPDPIDWAISQVLAEPLMGSPDVRSLTSDGR
jgi:hypothetical protein